MIADLGLGHWRSGPDFSAHYPVTDVCTNLADTKLKSESEISRRHKIYRRSVLLCDKMKTAVILAIISSVEAFHFTTKSASQVSSFQTFAETPTKKGTGFNYDASKYQDSNSGNYRRLTDQLNAVKAEEEQLKKERDELLRKEQMAAMFLRKENETFWNTPDNTIVATSDKFFVPPSVLQVIDDLDKELIGLAPVKEKMRRYASAMLAHKVRE